MSIANREAVSRPEIAHLCATRGRQLAARRAEALRSVPLSPTNHRDPETIIIQPTLHPATILELLRIGGMVTREQARSAWQAFPQERSWIEARAAVLAEGWAA